MSFFPLVDGSKRLVTWVGSGPGLVVGAGLYQALVVEVIAIRLYMRWADTGPVFNQFGTSG